MKKLTAAILGLFLVVSIQAETHVVKFCCSAGETYQPNALSVHVGDTVLFSGTFSEYPLRTTGVPPGAEHLNISSGTVYAYPVKVPGRYRFQSDDYLDQGMQGMITATLRPFGPLYETEEVSPSLELDGVIRDKVSSKGEVIGFTLGEEQLVTLRLLTLDEKPVITFFEGVMGKGTHWVELPVSKIRPGEYLCELNGQTVDVMRLVLAKGKR